LTNPAQVARDFDVYTTTSVSSFYHRHAHYLSLLDANELAVIDRFKFPQVRDNYIVAHGLLRETLAIYINESAGQLKFSQTEFGKPFLADYPELSFNMSHSGNSLAIAVAQQCQLGIDIEYYKSRATWAGLVKKCFALEEADYWHSLDYMSASADDLGLVTLVLRLQLSHFSHIKSGQEYIDDESV
jgi:4'-phosphopantetheinyl transferase